MVVLREKKTVKDGKILIDIPESFGGEVEVIVLAEGDGDSIKYWTDEEIENIGKTSVGKDLDDEDYSKW